MTPPPASIVIPTRSRSSYLEVALASLAPQAAACAAELIVVDDAGASERVRVLCERLGARYEPHGGPRGLNVARNTGVARSSGELVAFVDDDIRARPEWLEALLEAAQAHPGLDVFSGPIIPLLEGRAPRSCGREGPPITSLELGPEDTRIRYAWGTNMAIRRSALERVGPFDVSLEHGGDEQEWQDRLALATGAGDAPVLYVAKAAVEHRRAGADARLLALARTAHVRGRAARRFDARRSQQPTFARELLTLAACAGHVVRRRCPAGLTMVAHSAGRVREALREKLTRRAEAAGGRTEAAARGEAAGRDAAAGQDAAAGRDAGGATDDFLSGTSGTVAGLDVVRRSIADEALDATELLSGRRLRLRRAARAHPPRRRVLVLGVVLEQRAALARAAHEELSRSRHAVELRTRRPQGRGKFEVLNSLLEEGPVDDHDWLVVLDDDVELPRGFLDRFIFLSERFSLQLAQPAQRLSSHAAWPQTRRRAGSVVRETCFVEIGPVTAFARDTFEVLLPFPQLRMGWGLDVHWSALAREHGWRCGVVDAVAIGHRAAPVANTYSREDAVAEARAFLAERPHLTAAEARRTLSVHRRW